MKNECIIINSGNTAVNRILWKIIIIIRNGAPIRGGFIGSIRRIIYRGMNRNNGISAPD